jgi:hypothetical protein
MKHSPELKTKFLELRAQGVSYGRIAEELGVSKPTLIQWGKAMAEEIADLQAAERELVRERLLGNFEQWLGREVHHFNRLDEEFGRREFKYSPTESVFRMMMASRKLLDRYFFEEDRPRSRRSNGRAAAPRSTASQEANNNPKPESKSNDAQAARKGSTAVPSPGGEGQDEGGSVSFSSADQSKTPNPGSEIETTLAFPGIETTFSARVETQNPAKTLPFPSQNSGVHNASLSSHPSAPAQPDFSNRGSNAIGSSNIHGHWNPAPGVVSKPGPAPISNDGTAAAPLSADVSLPSPSGCGGEVSRAQQRSRTTTQGEGHTGPLSVSSGSLRLCVESAESRIENPNFRITAPPQSTTHHQSQLTIDDSPDFGGESVPISPYESTREWLERQGIVHIVSSR